MYYEYWGLHRAPFDNVPDPSMYVSSHTSVETTIAETIFAIEEGNECVGLIVGDVGLGKTLSLRIIIDSLETDKYRIVFITNPDMSFVQLLREIIGQLTGKQCEVKKKIDLLETFNKLLFETADSGKKVLIFIDEANAISPSNLESLRLLTNMQDDTRNLFTLVLAGQPELARRLEHPKRANFFQRVGTYCKINKIESEELLRDYIETRLKLAGGGRAIFTDDAVSQLWIYSEEGVPRLINKICKLCLKAGETNQFTEIGGDIVKQVAERFQKLTGPAIQKRKPRSRQVKADDIPKPMLPEVSPLQAYNEIITEITTTPSSVPEEADNRDNSIAAPSEEVKVEPPETSPAETAPEKTPTDPVELKDETEQEYLIGEAVIGKHTIKIKVPRHVFIQAQGSSTEQRIKFAGALAAQTLEKYALLSSANSIDPVTVWSEIRDQVLKKLSLQPE